MTENMLQNLIIGIETAFKLLGRWSEAHLINILVILVAAWLLRAFGTEALSRILRHAVRSEVYPSKADREKRVRTLRTLGSAAIRVGVYVIAGLLIISELNPGYTTALFASAGLATVALGFGAQSLIRDIVSGIFIITENQYRIGDEVTLTAGMGIGNVSGTVEDISIRTTILRDLDGDVHHVPNGNIALTTNKTIGFSRINEDIALALDTDLQRLEHIINHAGEEVAATPALKNKVIEAPYLASFKGFTDNGIVVKVLAKTTAADQWRVKSEFYRLLYKAFEKNSIRLAGAPKSKR